MNLAEAGLSECARDPSCSAEMDHEIWVLFWQGVGILALLAWVPVLVVVTVLVIRGSSTPTERLFWLMAVWALPVVGGISWAVSHNRLRS